MNLIDKIIFKYNYLLDFITYEISKTFRNVSNKNPHVISTDETINTILNNRVSVCRFGDGEIRLINNESIEFQSFNPKLGEKLKSIIYNDHSDVLVCLPEIFSGLKSYNKSTQYFWRKHFNNYKNEWFKLINFQKEYYNAFITRPYIAYSDKSKSRLLFEKIKQIWLEKDIVIVEGEKSRMGIGNDLFNGAKSINRIICPATNAFSVYDQIIFEIKRIPKSSLLLIALGPTATVLAFDLHMLGYQAIDIGHIDIEYEWYLMNAVSKIKIPTKYTNEAMGGNAPQDIFDPIYDSQIIKIIEKQHN